MTMKKFLATIFAVSMLSLSACGDSDESGDDVAAADESTDESNEAGEQSAQDIADELAGPSSGEAQATVELEGETYHFAAVEPGDGDDFYNFCTTVAGSLQGTLQQIDDSGAHLEGGEISFTFIEPGGDFESTGDPAELQIQLADGGYYSSFDGGEVDVPMSGQSASGDFTLGGVSGTVQASC